MKKQEGFILIDKSVGPTSHDVVDAVRKITGIKKVGHGGTLDPQASGLLVVGVGRSATKRLHEVLTKTKKTYLATLVLGQETDTLDSEGVIFKKVNNVIPPGEKEVRKVLGSFKGKINQIPPQYSATKINGKKAYELVREGKTVDLEPREVYIYSIKVKHYHYPSLSFRTGVGSGTYIRSLARDIGERLGVGAYLKSLRRLGIGDYDVKDAVKLDKINTNNWSNYIVELS